MKRNKRGARFFQALGILLLLGALGLTLYNRQESQKAGESAREGVAQIAEHLAQERARAEETQETEETQQPLVLPDPYPTEIPEMPIAQLGGRNYLGILSVPSQGIELPILSDFSMDHLQIAPCLFAGSYFEGNMVIAGHNYSTHFSPLKWIALNAEVILTAVDGSVYRYIVDNVEIVQPSQMEELLSGDWDLSLFTCTTGGQTRHVVRCIRAE